MTVDFYTYQFFLHHSKPVISRLSAISKKWTKYIKIYKNNKKKKFFLFFLILFLENKKRSTAVERYFLIFDYLCISLSLDLSGGLNSMLGSILV